MVSGFAALADGPAVEDARFQFLKGLVGAWTGPAAMDGMPASTIEFRLTAGGTAIEEVEFAGTPMEMVTLYHLDGKELVATHYCALGNQPRMTAAKRVVDESLSFACAGKPGNAASHDDEHVHGWTIKKDGDRLVYTAELVKSGKVTEAPRLVLTRTPETASR
jgi:hypothetical protein